MFRYKDIGAKKPVPKAWINRYITQYSLGCDDLSWPLIPASGTKIPLYCAGKTFPTIN